MHAASATLELTATFATGWPNIESAFLKCSIPRFESTCFYDNILGEIEKDAGDDGKQTEYCWLDADFEVVDFKGVDIKGVTTATVDEDETNKVPVTHRTWYTPTNFKFKCDRNGQFMSWCGGKASQETAVCNISHVMINSRLHPAVRGLQEQWLNYLWCPTKDRRSHSEHTLSLADYNRIFFEYGFVNLKFDANEIVKISVKISACAAAADHHRWLELASLAADGSMIGNLMHMPMQNGIALRIQEVLESSQESTLQNTTLSCPILEEGVLKQMVDRELETSVIQRRLEDRNMAVEKKMQQLEGDKQQWEIARQQWEIARQQWKKENQELTNQVNELKSELENEKQKPTDTFLKKCWNNCCPIRWRSRRQAGSPKNKKSPKSSSKKYRHKRHAAKVKKARKQRKDSHKH